jgi:hypothetical protein
MSVRVWAGPTVLLSNPTRYASKAGTYCTAHINFFPSNSDGTPASTWVLTIGRAADWTAASADTSLTDVFAGDLPTTIQNRDDLVWFLKARTIGSIPVGRRATIQANLDALGVPRADFTLTTPLWRVFRRIVSTLMEQDDNYGGGFHF